MSENLNNNTSQLTTSSIVVSDKEAREFMTRVSKQLTDRTKEYVVRDLKTGTITYYVV